LKRYLLQLSYKGTKFHGWQLQPNAYTVQQEIQETLMKIFQNKIEITGAGRTDTGVHSKFYVAHFDINEEVNGEVNEETLLKKMNSMLCKDISVKKIFNVEDSFHARFDAISRTYQYYINFTKNPFKTETSYYLYWKPDIKKMNAAAQILFNYTDFTSFSKLHTDVKTNNCRIYLAEWKEINEGMIFTIKADRFLRNMVRAIVGTLLDIGKYTINEEDMKKIIESKNRSNAGSSVPAHGLFLSDIEYPEIVDKQLIRLSENY